MSTTTIGTVLTTEAAKSERPGLFSRFLASLIASREAQARRQVAAEFARMSTERLLDMGFTPDQAARVRETGRIPADYWA